MTKEYQLIIMGGGPAGLSAGLYAARDKLNVALVEKNITGGLANNAELIENYPGFPDGISGFELGEKMLQQAEKFGMQTLMAEIRALEIKEHWKVVKTSEGDLTAQAVIIALGSERINLNVPGEKEFIGRGVSYCATCDAAFFKDQPVAVVGGGNAAVSEALHLAKFANKVFIIHRRYQFRATPIFLDKAKSNPKITFITGTTVNSIEGNNIVQNLHVTNVMTKEKSTLSVAGVFISIGQKPNTDFLKGIVPMDANGYIITNEKMETAVPGLLAAGDIRSSSIRQTISAAGDGATAAIYAYRYIEA